MTSNGASSSPAGTVDMNLEVVALPVSDPDRAKDFYQNLGWRLDADIARGDTFRVIQFTPLHSACSIQFGLGLTTGQPGSVQRLILAVSGINAARQDLIARGAAVSEVFHLSGSGPVPGPDPEGRSYQSYASFSDPDGNEWLLQEITARLPGRGFSLDVATLTELLRETEARHGEYEPTAPKHHWSEWYGAYIVGRERGRTPDEAAKDATMHVEQTRGGKK